MKSTEINMKSDHHQKIQKKFLNVMSQKHFFKKKERGLLNLFLDYHVSEASNPLVCVICISSK